MEQRQTISQITECVISEMERMQYSPATISTFRVKAKQLSRYVQEKTGTDYFTEELGRRYLADTIGFPFAENRWLTSPEASHIRCVRRIGEDGIAIRFSHGECTVYPDEKRLDFSLIHFCMALPVIRRGRTYLRLGRELFIVYSGANFG